VVVNSHRAHSSSLHFDLICFIVEIFEQLHELAHCVSFFGFASSHLQLVILGRMRSFQWANIAEVAELSFFFNYFAIYFLISIQIKAVTELSTSLRRASIEDVNCCEGPSELFFFLFTQIFGQIGTSENLIKSFKSYCSWSFFLWIALSLAHWSRKSNNRIIWIFFLQEIINLNSLFHLISESFWHQIWILNTRSVSLAGLWAFNIKERLICLFLRNLVERRKQEAGLVISRFNLWFCCTLIQLIRF